MFGITTSVSISVCLYRHQYQYQRRKVSLNQPVSVSFCYVDVSSYCGFLSSRFCRCFCACFWIRLCLRFYVFVLYMYLCVYMPTCPVLFPLPTFLGVFVGVFECVFGCVFGSVCVLSFFLCVCFIFVFGVFWMWFDYFLRSVSRCVLCASCLEIITHVWRVPMYS